MANKTRICEEIEIALLSDAELTEEQKNHIENCQGCKALLSSIEKMKGDLSGLSVPNIKEGQIADAVMKKIVYGKSSHAAFKWYRHMGTAAAAVIILVAALIIKNPSAELDKAANDTASPLKTASEQSAETQMENPTIPFKESGDGEIMRSMIMKAEGSEKEFAYAENEDNINVAYDTSLSGVTTEDGLSSEEAMTKDEVTDKSFGTKKAEMFFSSEDNGSSNGAFAGTSAEPVKLFEGVEFLSGEENFDYNISLANSVLEKSHPNYIIRRELLEKQDYNNERFIYVMSLLTENDFIVATGSKNTIFIKK